MKPPAPIWAGAGNYTSVMKITEQFRSKAAAKLFSERLVSSAGQRLYPSFYVMNNRYACTVSGDFTQEQVDIAKQ